MFIIKYLAAADCSNTHHSACSVCCILCVAAHGAHVVHCVNGPISHLVKQFGRTFHNFMNTLSGELTMGLVRVPHSYSDRLAARVWGIRGQLLNSEKMFMLSVELSVTPLPIK